MPPLKRAILIGWLLRSYFIEADMSKFTASIIDFMNHDLSMGNVLTPTHKIQELLANYNQRDFEDL